MLLENRDCTFLWSHLIEQRAVAYFFTLNGLSLKDIHTEYESVQIDEALCLQTVYIWHKHFMQGRSELFDDPRSGRPLQNDFVDALRAMIQEFPFYFVQASLYELHTHNEYLLTHLTQCSPFENVQFIMGASLSRRCSKGRTSLTFHGHFHGSQRKSKNGFVQVITGDES
jgi:hypothetical protein